MDLFSKNSVESYYTFVNIIHKTEHVEEEMQTAKSVDKGIPIKSQVAFGMTIPTLGRTQYLFGDVVLTCQHRT